MALFEIPELPDDALAASATFHSLVLPDIRQALADELCDLTLVFAPAGHSHTAWRLAAVQELARQVAPIRVNAVAGDGETAIAAAADYLARAPGVTGQYLPLDDKGAGRVL